MKILAIETSCDDTGIAFIECKGLRLSKTKTDLVGSPQFNVLKNLVSSQIKFHRPFGGVVPNIAKREHLRNLPLLYKKIFKGQTSKERSSKRIQTKKLKVSDVDAIAVTVGPGLEPALWTGINFAGELAQVLKKPLIGGNHLEGHIYSNILENVRILFPAVCLLVSGGHTILLRMDSLTKWEKLGETRDDAVGEAFDKVARLLKLPYPGGPEIEKLAKEGDCEKHNFPRPMMYQKNYDFSFSGLKTSVLYFIRNNSRAQKKHIAASFQKAAIDVLTEKTMKAIREFKAKSVLLCGGVAANSSLRENLKSKSKMLGIKFFGPQAEYNGDNAAMIGVSAYINYLRKKKFKMEANGNLNL